MSTSVSHRECPVCGAADARPVYHQRFAVEDDGTRIAGYHVVVCRPCGAVYADGIPSQEVLDAYYRDFSKYEFLDDRGEPPAWLTRSHGDLVAGLVQHLAGRETVIVDVGCGNGDVLGMLKKAGYRHLLGVDLAPGSPEAARRVHDVGVVPGSALGLPPEVNGAGCIIFSAVLEHLRDVQAALRAAASRMAPEGLIYAEVPDLERFELETMPPFQQFSLEHVNFFTAASLANAAAPVGLEMTAHWQALREIGPSEEPALCAVFRRSEPRRRPPERDATGEAAVARYIEACARFEEEVAARIDALVAAATPMILWGVGTHTLHLLESTSLRNANIVALVDANPRLHGMRVGDARVAAPESIAGRPEALLICSPLRQDEIVQMARERLAMSNHILTLYEPPPPAGATDPGQRRTGKRP